MAGGQIAGFFRRPRPGQPLRAVANVDNLNKVANILNDISGEGCTIDKPTDGRPWVVRYTGESSDNLPLLMPHEIKVEILAENQAKYDESTDRIAPVNVSVHVNGLAASVAYDDPTYAQWQKSAGVKTLWVYQSFAGIYKDSNGQYLDDPKYEWTCEPLGQLTLYGSPIANIPYCRVEIPEVGKPPKIRCLLEGPVNLYCHRGDAEGRCYATYIPYAVETATRQTSKTIAGTSLPLSIHNLGAATDGFYDEYPNGRYQVIHTEHGDEVDWLDPEELAKDRNDAKLLLFRYIAHDSNIMRGRPYWRTVEQFKTASASWTNELINESFEVETPSWAIAAVCPLAAEVWAEDPGPFELKCPDRIGNVEVLAAVMDASGNWHSVADVLALDDEIDESAASYGELKDRADLVAPDIDDAAASLTDTQDLLDHLEDELHQLNDHSGDAAEYQAEAAQEALDAASLASDFASLDARITALEQRATA